MNSHASSGNYQDMNNISIDNEMARELWLKRYILIQLQCAFTWKYTLVNCDGASKGNSEFLAFLCKAKILNVLI